MIKKEVSFFDFCDSFSDTYKDNFTYEGKRALYDYLEALSEDIGEDIELDTIALCCEYSEYTSAIDCIKECQYLEDKEAEEMTEDEAIEWLEYRTQVIKFDNGIIIQDF